MIGMMCFPGMFEPHIKNSRLKIPDDIENYSKDEYPHYFVFEQLHLATPIDISSLEDNANIIADISDEKIKQITMQELLDLGLYVETSDYLV